MLAFLAEMVSFSRYLESECAVHGLQYVDASDGLAEAIEAAYGYLVSDE